MLSIILSSLALAAAIICVVITMQERKRSRERNVAHEKESKELRNEFCARLDNRDILWKRMLKEQGDAWEKAVTALRNQIADLENGAVPDYEKAKAAAKAVDNFHDGLANILNFDPYEAARMGRNDGGDAP